MGLHTQELEKNFSKKFVTELSDAITAFIHEAQTNPKKTNLANGEAVRLNEDLATLRGIQIETLRCLEVAFFLGNVNSSANHPVVLIQVLSNLLERLQPETQEYLLNIAKTLQGEPAQLTETEPVAGVIEFSASTNHDKPRRILRRNSEKLLSVEGKVWDKYYFDLLFFLSVQTEPISFVDFFNATVKMGVREPISNQAKDEIKKIITDIVIDMCKALNLWIREHGLGELYEEITVNSEQKSISLKPKDKEEVSIPFFHDSQNSYLILCGEKVELSKKQNQLIAELSTAQAEDGWRDGAELISDLNIGLFRRLQEDIIDRINATFTNIYRPLDGTFFEVVRHVEFGITVFDKMRINPHFQAVNISSK